jgi:hypothetical protein
MRIAYHFVTERALPSAVGGGKRLGVIRGLAERDAIPAQRHSAIVATVGRASEEKYSLNEERRLGNRAIAVLVDASAAGGEGHLA